MIDPQGGEGIAPPPCLSYEQIFIAVLRDDIFPHSGKGNKIFPVTGKSGKNIDKMFPDSHESDKMFPDSDRGKKKQLKSDFASGD